MVEPIMRRDDVQLAPLSGVKVLDLTANMTGPFATMMLAEQGAEVIKIEPPDGDIVRRIGPGRRGTSAYFVSLNRGKRSIVIDLQQPAGAELVARLARNVDVFIENFRPGVTNRLGLGAERLQAANSRLIYVSISGFGTGGPMSSSPAYDHVIQALSGIAARQASRDGVPLLVKHGIVDKATGYNAAQAVSTALFERERTGHARRIEVAMIDVALSLLWPDGMMSNTCLDEVDDAPSIAGTFRTTPTADGYICLVTVTDRQFQGLLRAVELSALADDERVSNVEQRMRHGGEIMRKVAAVIATTPTSTIVERLRREEVPCAPVVRLDEVATSEVVIARRSLAQLVDPSLGRIIQPVPAARFDGLASDALGAPGLGEHTEQVLKSFAISTAEIDDLRRLNVIG
jgi:crotonobetainyl-CoA:carnitine CoA-transferase CaiB-like acyl-CoA transferase